ncbi:MAG TPA: DUF255 domain-containing protein [Magnetospirillaceae bacterium]|jgi:hypothetical protein
MLAITRSSIRLLGCAVVALLLAIPYSRADDAPAPIAWQNWSDDLFVRAAQTHKFVILDLEAVWCHWCHVMDERTYRDAKVIGLIDASYIPVRVDQDSRPDLFERYKEYGWPATIIFAPDGSERVKLSGYYGAKLFAGVLIGALETPAKAIAALQATKPASHIPDAQRAGFEHDLDASFDAKNAGWGRGYKYIDGDAMAYSLDRAAYGDKAAEQRARATLDQNLKLIDPVWGGVYQYSDQADWMSPHFEKIMPLQAVDLRAYSDAYARWRDPRYRQAADAVFRYLRDGLRAPDGGFYVSQDADLSPEIDGHHYYVLDDAGRRALGQPKIDQHRYARETGLAVAALVSYYDATGTTQALDMAKAAADWALKERALPDGGFRHDAVDRYGPFLGDSLAMADAFLALYRSTGERRYLAEARRTADFILAHFADTTTGALTAEPAQSPKPDQILARPKLSVDGNIDAARFLNLLSYVSWDQRYRKMAETILGYLISPQVPAILNLLPGALLLDRELSREPIHVTVIGPHGDAETRQLAAAALAYPADYKRVDQWDRREGPLPSSDIDYPPEPAVAAYACSQNLCSLPVTEPAQLAAALDRLVAKQTR